MEPRQFGERPKNKWLNRRRELMSMKKKLELVKKELDKERNETNDGLSQIAFVKDHLTELFVSTFRKVNSTVSIDEKIKLLSESAQSAVSWVEQLEDDISKKLSTIDSKLEVLQELIDHQDKLDLATLQDAESEDM